MAQTTASDAAAISAHLRQTWDRPDAKMVIEPIVVEDKVAIAGWVQDDRGGRALLRMDKDGWQVILCSGDHLRDVETVKAVGIDATTASALIAKLLAAEAQLPPAHLAKLALFDGVLMIAPGQAHGPTGHHPHNHK